MITLLDDYTTGIYLIKTTHKVPLYDGSDVYVHLDGWGRTTHEEKRIKSYIGHSGCKQQFSDLYYGPTDIMEDLEDSRKALQAHTSIKLGRWVWEWVDPNSGVTYDDLKNWFENRVKKGGYPVYRVKKIHMPYGPFTGNQMFNITDICADQLKYLEEIY